MKTLLLAAVAVLCGCAVPVPAPVVVEKAVWKPCEVAVPDAPIYPADTLTGNEDIWTFVTTLWADREARKGYELKVTAALIGCTQKQPSP